MGTKCVLSNLHIYKEKKEKSDIHKSDDEQKTFKKQSFLPKYYDLKLKVSIVLHLKKYKMCALLDSKSSTELVWSDKFKEKTMFSQLEGIKLFNHSTQKI